jgi:predicted TIM-barrel fold metal-dependent hydrolase
MKFDIYAHFIPPKLKKIIFEKQKTIVELQTSTAVHDLDLRFRMMDRHPDVLQVLTVPGATMDELAEPGKAVDLAKSVNDEMAELVFRYPDRFVAGVAVLPVGDIDASLEEIDRAVNDLKLRGILLRIPIHGKPVDRPEFFPIYEKMSQLNLPIWFHPDKNPKVPDYPDENESKYIIWHLWGLPIETTFSMTRLVFSGVLERYPNLKIITHHCGGMVPYFAERIINHYNQSEMRNRTNFKNGLTEAPIEYFKRFYTDTAILGNTPALMCAYHFYGAEHILFGTDAPFDSLVGAYGTPRTIEAIEGMDIPAADKEMIFEKNARRLLRLPA